MLVWLIMMLLRSARVMVTVASTEFEVFSE